MTLFSYLWIVVDRVFNRFKSSCQTNLTTMSCSRDTDFIMIVQTYQTISQLKRNLDDSLSSISFIWLASHFIETYFCFMRANFSSYGDTFFKVFTDWTFFTLETIALLYVTAIVDRCREKKY